MNYNYNPKSKARLLFKELDDGGVIYDPEKEQCHSLNTSSAYIWSLCDGKNSISEIISQIKADFSQFKIDPEEAVNTAIQTFSNLNLLEE